MQFKTTKQVLREINVPSSRFYRAVLDEAFQLPQKFGRAFHWTQEDIERAKKFFAEKKATK